MRVQRSNQVTWLLAECRDLKHLAILSQLVHKNVRSSVNKFNIVISTKEFHLPFLTSVVWEMRNQTFPSLLEGEILSRLTSQCSQVLTKTTPLFSRQKVGVAIHKWSYQLPPEERKEVEESLSRQDHLVCFERSGLLLPRSGEEVRNLRELSTSSSFSRSSMRTNLEKLEKLLCNFSPFHYDDDDWHTSFRKLFGKSTKLKHLEMRSSSEKGCVDLVLNELVSVADPQLQTLILADVSISARQSQILARLFQVCHHLSHLQLTDIRCSDQRLFADLERALQSAKQLKHLQIHQKQLTQHCAKLLTSLANNCDILEAVVLIDPSRAFNLKKFPTENVIKLVKKKSVRFLYLCSELLTVNDIKSLKRSLKTVMASKPHLFVKLQSTLVFTLGASESPFYSLEVINDLPMEFQNMVATLAGNFNYRHLNTSVARVTVDNIF